MSVIHIPKAFQLRLDSEGRYERDIHYGIYIPIDSVREWAAIKGLVCRVNEWYFWWPDHGETWEPSAYIPAKLMRIAMVGDGTEDGMQKAREEIWRLAQSKGAE